MRYDAYYIMVFNSSDKLTLGLLSKGYSFKFFNSINGTLSDFKLLILLTSNC
jgi:hypothetical protein